MNPLYLIAAYLLGALSFGVFVLVALMLLHRPRYVAPTKHARRWRDLPLPETVPSWVREEASVEPIYMYGVTGEER